MWRLQVDDDVEGGAGRSDQLLWAVESPSPVARWHARVESDERADGTGPDERPDVLELAVEGRFVGADRMPGERSGVLELAGAGGFVGADRSPGERSDVPDLGGAGRFPSADRLPDEDVSWMAELDATVGPASRGDNTALARVLEIIRPIALRYCRGKIGPYDRSGVSADDVAQDICLAVLTALPRYRDESRPFMAFVYGIAGHKIADVHRATGRNKTDAVAEIPEMPSVDNNPEDKVIAFESSREIGTLLGVLSPKDRDILVLRVALGMSSEETAETMDTTPGAIRVAQHRALGKLRAAQARVAAGEPLDPKAGRKKRTRRRKKVDG